MKHISIRLAAAAAALMLATASLTACGSSAPASSATQDSAPTQPKVTASPEKQASAAAHAKEVASAAKGTAVKTFVETVIDKSAYTKNNNIYKANKPDSVKLVSTIKYADGNTFRLGDPYKTVTDKGYASDQDDKTIKAHTISDSIEAKNKDKKAIAVAMRNTTDKDQPIKNCAIFTLKYYYDKANTCQDFEYAGITSKSAPKDIFQALGKEPDSIYCNEKDSCAVMTYQDTANKLTLEIEYSITEKHISRFMLNIR